MTVSYQKSVKIEAETVSYDSGNVVPGKYYGDLGQEFSMEHFKKGFKIQIMRETERELDFDMIGVDASFANAIRRIIISEVPTVAPDQVFIMKNNSLLSDEILSHRLGLIPIDVDPRLLQFPSESKEDLNVENTLVFELKVACKSKGIRDENLEFKDRFENHFVYSRDLRWVPQGDQAERFAGNPPKPLIDDIVIAKLRPGQEIDLKIFAFKGIGADHAKWSPVATASYRILPEITIKQDIKGADAVKFAQCFPKGVIGIGEDGKAFVINARNDTVSRECLRHKEFEGKVELSRKADHFIFSVEAVSTYSPREIVQEAFKILISKCQRIKETLN